MDFLKYLGMLLNRAAQKSVLLTDRLTILIVPFATLGLWLVGTEMTDSIQEALFLGIAIAVVAVVVLRLIAASYFVWKEDQYRKATLRAEIERPERQAEASMKEYTIDLRRRLSGALGKLSAYAVYPVEVLEHHEEFEELPKLITEIDALIHQLSYDFPVRISAICFRDYCLSILHKGESPGEHFWEQRRLTFRLLHKEDSVVDYITLMELEILLEDAGLKADNQDDVVGEFKALMRQLGDGFRDPEVQNDLRQSLLGKTVPNLSAIRSRLSQPSSGSETPL